MAALKTLKDFDIARDNQIVQDELVRRHYDLRQEAIKVVKYYRELLKDKKPTNIDYKNQFINASREGAIAVMTEFFNITEEDLK